MSLERYGGVIRDHLAEIVEIEERDRRER